MHWYALYWDQSHRHDFNLLCASSNNLHSQMPIMQILNYKLFLCNANYMSCNRNWYSYDFITEIWYSDPNPCWSLSVLLHFVVYTSPTGIDRRDASTWAWGIIRQRQLHYYLWRQLCLILKPQSAFGPLLVLILTQFKPF